jgi:hypothetical protein
MKLTIAEQLVRANLVKQEHADRLSVLEIHIKDAQEVLTRLKLNGATKEQIIAANLRLDLAKKYYINYAPSKDNSGRYYAHLIKTLIHLYHKSTNNAG